MPENPIKNATTELTLKKPIAMEKREMVTPKQN